MQDGPITCSEIINKMDYKKTSLNGIKRDMKGINPIVSGYNKLEGKAQVYVDELEEMQIIKDKVC